MASTQTADSLGPRIAGKPGEHDGLLILRHCSWCFVETSNAKSQTRRICKGVFMAAVYFDAGFIARHRMATVGANKFVVLGLFAAFFT